MHIICFTAGIVCALYFIILLIYSGFTSAFYLVWPAMAVCFLLLGWLFHIHFFAQLPPSVRGILLAFVAIGILVFVGVEGMILRAATLDPASGLDYVIVLGAHVRSTGPSRALALRLDAALDYAAENPDTIFIVSGGQGSNEPCTEARYHEDLSGKPRPFLRPDPDRRPVHQHPGKPDLLSRTYPGRRNCRYHHQWIPCLPLPSPGRCSWLRACLWHPRKRRPDHPTSQSLS